MDYIYIIDKNNKKEKMEVVTIFNITNSDYEYIIYKPINENEYYVGKYLGNNITNLDINLTKQEMVYAESILQELVGE